MLKDSADEVVLPIPESFVVTTEKPVPIGLLINALIPIGGVIATGGALKQV
jgi:hypothetical protein